MASLTISPYSTLLERKLFLSTQSTVPQLPSEIADSVDDEFQAGLKHLKYLILQAQKLQSDEDPDYKPAYMIPATLAKDLLLSPKLPDPNDYDLIYKLWEIRLSCLVLSNEQYCFSVAKQEAKKVSNHLFKLTNVLHGEPRRIGFPVNLPLSLEILIIRLRTNGPTNLGLGELFSLSWIIRQLMEKQELVNNKILYSLSFNVSAILIAKRDYLTFSTHASSILINIDYRKGESIDKEVYSHYVLLNSLVYMLQGEFSKSEESFDMLINLHDTLDENPSIVSLKTVLSKIAPIIDNDGSLGSIPLKEEPIINNWSDLRNLQNSVRITDRIICCFCALFEAQLRIKAEYLFGSKDLGDTLGTFQEWKTNLISSSDKLESTEELFKELINSKKINTSALLDLGWMMNFNKLYGFE